MAPKKPLEEYAYEYMKQRINDGTLEAGVIYSETKMAAKIGISRTPLRTALAKLRQDHYIDILPSKGFQVHNMTLDDIHNTYQSRIAVEGYCTLYLHWNKHTPEGQATLKELDRILHDAEHALKRNTSAGEYLPLDDAFHQVIVAFCKNRELMALFENYNHLLRLIALKTFEAPGRFQHSLSEHREIYQSILSEGAHAGEAVYRSVIRHIDATKQCALSVLEQNNTAPEGG